MILCILLEIVANKTSLLILLYHSSYSSYFILLMIIRIILLSFLFIHIYISTYERIILKHRTETRIYFFLSGIRKVRTVDSLEFSIHASLTKTRLKVGIWTVSGTFTPKTIVYLRVYVHIYIYISIHMHTCIYAYVNMYICIIYMHICKCKYVLYICICICKYVNIYICIRVYICIYVYM